MSKWKLYIAKTLKRWNTSVLFLKKKPPMMKETWGTRAKTHPMLVSDLPLLLEIKTRYQLPACPWPTSYMMSSLELLARAMISIPNNYDMD
jgi:hypothetical protein